MLLRWNNKVQEPFGFITQELCHFSLLIRTKGQSCESAEVCLSARLSNIKVNNLNDFP